MKTRPTREFIKQRVLDHIAYGWSKSPGTHDRNIEWTEEDTKIYNEEWEKAKKIKET